MNTKIKKIIKQAIDIHVHIGPEIIPRKYTVQKLINAEQDKIGGFVLKNHFYPTIPFIREVENAKGLKIIGSIALNNSVGGLNSESIYSSSLISQLPIMVWFPTINAGNFLKKTEFEIASEWVRNKEFVARKSKDVKPVQLKSKKIAEVLKTIKTYNAILATGHISWKESVSLIERAQKFGVKKIVITHPIYQKINMPIRIQQELAGMGCFIEQSYSMYTIDKIPIENIAQQIKDIGSKSVILSSDVGQTFSLSPSQALYKFSALLLQEGITYKELYIMLVENPRKLLSID